MSSTCLTCGESFEILPEEAAFLKKLEFKFGDNVFYPAEPTFCPQCRLQRRTVHRNERFFYKTKSALSGKDIVALYADEPMWGAPYKVYSQEEWKADSFDPLVYGRDFDLNRPFFEQFGELLKDVPRVALVTVSNENSDYSTGTGFCKNCYLINSSEYAEDCYYGKLYQNCKTSVDCSYLYDSQLCYDCFNVYNSYNCSHLTFAKNCSDCHFSSNLQSCKNCFLCTNLVQKEYHFLNEKLEPAVYQQRVNAVLGSWTKTQEALKKLNELRSGAIHKYANIVNSEGCTGDYIENSQQCVDCYDMTDSQDCRNVTVGVNIKDCIDCSNMYLKPELCYDTLGTIEAHTVAYCLYIFYSQRMLYCDTCYNCSDCFGCSGLTRKKYCIFNKQFTKEEYESIVPQIITHMQKTREWGSFFPPAISSFAYNESLAGEYMPLSKEEALIKGFHWRDENVKDKKPQTYVQPDHIRDVTDDVLKEFLVCETCTKNFKIIPQELSFYRNQTVPLPHQCHDCRYMQRMQLRNPRTLWKRGCMKCGTEMQTTYDPSRPEVVYCEKCYLEAVY